MRTLAARLSDTRPGRERIGRWTAVAYHIQQARFWPAYRGAVVSFLAMLSTVAGLVLMIGCLNLANLLLARAAGRQGELAVRLALGAGVPRLARQLVTESLTLAVLGGLAGAAVAGWTTRFLSGFRHAFRIPLTLDTGWDGRVLAFAVGITLMSGVIFGLVPAVRLARADLNTLLKSGLGGSRNTRLRSAFVVAQVALSVVLLSGAGLFVRTLRNARASDVTQASEDVLLAPVDTDAAGYDMERGTRIYQEILERARRIPGVRAAGLTSILPMSGFRGGTDAIVADAANPSDRRAMQVDFNPVSDGYFETAGLPVLGGRGFRSGDRAGAPRVGVVNERWVQRFWPGREPIGKQIQLTEPAGAMVVVVGVVRDGKYRSYRDAVRPCLYVPLAQQYVPSATLEVRAAAHSPAVLPALRRELLSVDRTLAADGITTMQAHLDDSLSQERLSATLLSGFAGLALSLSMIGIYGVMAYAAAQRKREIGVRIALGARPVDIGRPVAVQGLRLAAAGVGAGCALGLVLARLVSSLLYGVSAADPPTYVAAAALLLTAAAAASWLPARRAARTDPVSALRQE
jgi:predicted permease